MRLPILCLVLAAGTLAAAQDPDSAAVKKALQPLQGTWKVVAIEAKGKEMPEALPPFGLVIAGNEMKPSDDKVQVKIVLKVHPGTDPLAVDFTFEVGKDKNTLEGICQVEGDTLKLAWCQTPNLKQRPSEFSTKEDNDHLLIVLQRQKD